jgi:hypothetical protein
MLKKNMYYTEDSGYSKLTYCFTELNKGLFVDSDMNL